jgi:TfoX/Sxy family transcriptional regulator of competence genes
MEGRTGLERLIADLSDPSRRKGVWIVANKRAAPVWRRSPDDLIALFYAALPNDPRVERRKMFGYPCAFVAGNLFAGLHQESVIVRLAENERAAAIAEQGACIFEPMPGRPMREYIALPDAALKGRGKLTAWLQRALDYAASLPTKQRRPRRAAKSASPARRKRA